MTDTQLQQILARIDRIDRLEAAVVMLATIVQSQGGAARLADDILSDLRGSGRPHAEPDEPQASETGLLRSHR